MPSHPHREAVYTTDEIRRIETAAAAHNPAPDLMERAGLAAAELAKDLVTAGKRIAILAGPGNNGGDAFVAARHLRSQWLEVDVCFTGDASKLSADAAAAFSAWRESGGTVSDALPAKDRCGLVIDGLFGIGLTRDLKGRYAELVTWASSMAGPVLALDIPSGIESDSGRALGCAIRATHTMTFIGLKPGLLTLEGPDHCGDIHVATLGLDSTALVPPNGHTIGSDILASLPRRKINSHKGDYGSVGIIGGADGMVGAALLSGRAAIKLGAGRVYVGLAAKDAPRVDLLQPELMLREADSISDIEHLTCLAVGPGLGQSPESATLLEAALATRLPLVLDADALNLIALREGLRLAVGARDGATILTPHPAEAARLLDTSTVDVQRDRVGAARRIASSLRCAVVLKGAGSVCAWPDGRWSINTSGNAGMASAGMGDVLTGMLAALVAQRIAPDVALEFGVYLHGAAADGLVATGIGPAGLTAGEVIDSARRLANCVSPTKSASP